MIPSPSQPGRGSGQAGYARLKLLDLCEQLILAAMPVLDKVPRAHRYRYGAQLEAALFGLLPLIVQAASAGTKTKVYALADHLEVLNSLLRIGAERKLISPRFVGHIMAAPAEGNPAGGPLRQIGAMTAVWRKSVKDSGR